MAADNQKCFCRVSYIGHLDLATFSTVFHFVVNLFVASIGTFFFFFIQSSPDLVHTVPCTHVHGYFFPMGLHSVCSITGKFELGGCVMSYWSF